MAKQRPFNPRALTEYANDEIRPPMGIGALVWRYLVLLPLNEAQWGKPSRQFDIVSPKDKESMQAMLVEHFGGLTVFAPVFGYGLRNPNDLSTIELNNNLPLVIYARPIALADRYFDRLQREMQDAFGQGLILIERQEAFLFGNPQELPLGQSTLPKRRPRRKKQT